MRLWKRFDYIFPSNQPQALRRRLQVALLLIEFTENVERPKTHQRRAFFSAWDELRSDLL